MFEKLLQWDRDTLIYLNNLGVAQWETFWSTITTISTWIPFFLFLIIVLIWVHGRKRGLLMVLTILTAVLLILLLTHFVKDGVGRVRPNNDVSMNALIRVLKHPTDFSFFSGHAATSFLIAILVWLFLRKKTSWASLLFVWALLFTASRIFVGVHYPSDILVGTLVGITFGLLFYRLYQRFIKPYSK